MTFEEIQDNTLYRNVDGTLLAKSLLTFHDGKAVSSLRIILRRKGCRKDWGGIEPSDRIEMVYCRYYKSTLPSGLEPATEEDGMFFEAMVALHGPDILESLAKCFR